MIETIGPSNVSCFLPLAVNNRATGKLAAGTALRLLAGRSSIRLQSPVSTAWAVGIKLSVIPGSERPNWPSPIPNRFSTIDPALINLAKLFL
jgi:hypothetical protein